MKDREDTRSLRRALCSGVFALGVCLLSLNLRGETTRSAGTDWWSLQAIERPAIPGFLTVPTQGQGNPIDAFLDRVRQKQGLSGTPPASRRALIRRLSFDLVGLPPSQDDVDEFIQDESPRAYEQLVDRLLSSPGFGERWARHWLDVARFGESHGFERDHIRLHAWRYRDWVIDAFNHNLPYDEFVKLQLAGDVIEGAGDEGVVATGFLVAGAYDAVGQSQQSAAMRAVVRQDEMEDYIGTVGQAFLGLTIHCARCHDHKFDPIEQREYYQIAAALAGVKPGDREVTTVSMPQRYAARIRALEDRLESQAKEFRKEGLAGRIAASRGGDEGPDAEAIADDDMEGAIQASLGEVALAARRAAIFELGQAKEQRDRVKTNRVYAVKPHAPKVVHVLVRGNPSTLGDPVEPAGLAAVTTVPSDFDLGEAPSDGARRRALAAWIANARNPLFARVIVNRLWQHHFGAGLVATPSDFGFSGGQASHPALLDWLAVELVDRGWDMKAIHRLIVTSSAYRQSSRSRPEGLSVDAENRLLWRMNPRRLEAEALRDAILLVSGELNREIGGPGFQDFSTYVHNSQFYKMLDPVGESFHRRSLYRMWIRSGRSPFLDVFDCPDPSASAPKRPVTTTPLQSLTLMNHSFVLRMSDAFGDRMRVEGGPDLRAQIDWAFRQCFGRSPAGVERSDALVLLREHGASALARILFNSSEFVYVD